jgi:hypothetical protein
MEPIDRTQAVWPSHPTQQGASWHFEITATFVPKRSSQWSGAKPQVDGTGLLNCGDSLLNNGLKAAE